MSASSAASFARIGLVGFAIALASAAVAGHAAEPVQTPPQPPAAVAASPDMVAKGRELFNNWSCSSCHSLADAEATGHVGPAFDGNAGLTEAFVVDRVTNGQGAMPAFGGQMSDAEIARIAFYITDAK